MLCANPREQSGGGGHSLQPDARGGDGCGGFGTHRHVTQARIPDAPARRIESDTCSPLSSRPIASSRAPGAREGVGGDCGPTYSCGHASAAIPITGACKSQSARFSAMDKTRA